MATQTVIAPCECCGYPTGRTIPDVPLICGTCVRVYRGEWEAQPGQPTQAEVIERIRFIQLIQPTKRP